KSEVVGAGAVRIEVLYHSRILDGFRGLAPKSLQYLRRLSVIVLHQGYLSLVMVDIGITSPDHVTLLIRQSRRGGIASGQRDVSFQNPELRRIGLTQFRNHLIGNLLRLIVVAECEMKIGELLR